MAPHLPDLLRVDPDAVTTAVTELDALATPFDLRGAVDVLLDDLDASAWAVPSATPAERSAHRAAVATRRGGGGRPVLVVDASAIARKFLMQRLEALGYQAQGADSGEQALVMVESQAFAIVFAEFVLGPKHSLDGLGLCQAIRQRRDHPLGVAPAVVMATGRTGSADRVRATLAGCDAYLTKPLTEAAFVAALADIDPQFK
jgi:CheY-like chemotaxis protein